jgi:hypothetical protein
MAARIYSVEYYYSTVEDQPGQGCRFLEMLAAEQVNLLAFNAFPISGAKTQLIIYPLNSTWLADVARRKGLMLQGPFHALMIHGDDELGALVGIHQKLCAADINVASATGLSNGRGGYRYIMHVSPEDFDRAVEVLGVEKELPSWHELKLDIFRRFEGKGGLTTPLKNRQRRGAI